MQQPEPLPAQSTTKYGDAEIIRPYDDSQYGQSLVLSFGRDRKSKHWTPEAMPVAQAVALFSRHRVGPKDGLAVVFGDMVPGQRLKTSVKALYGVGLDIDTGTPTDVVDAALEKLGCLAVRYSTHSAGKTRSEIKKDKVMKFAGDREIDADLMLDFLREVEQWDKSMVDNADYLGTDHTENGIVCQIAHPPMPKHRIILFFKEPFVIGNEGKTQADATKKWEKVPEALARLLNVPFDTSCKDASRLFYLPRHAKGAPWGISLFGGPYFDWRRLELDDPMERLGAALTKGKSKSVTDEGRELGRWSLKHAHGFQIADVIDAHAPDRIRHNAGRGYEIECPFDEDHSNAGDQEDRACLVVNGGEGSSEFFTISCRHETCRDKTNLDMLGKMLKDGWFPKEVIDDEQFNAILEDEDKSEVAVRLEKQDKAKAGYLVAIERLTPNSSDTEVDEVAALILEADLAPHSETRAIKAMSDRLDSTVTTVKATLKALQRKSKPGKAVKPIAINDNGHVTFSYTGDFNFDEACDVCSGALTAKNMRDAMPTYSQLNGKAVRLTIHDERCEFSEMTQNGFWSELNSLVTFVRHSERKESGVRQHVNRDVAAHVYEQAYKTMPPAPEVLYTPVFLSDGSLLQTPKYHFEPSRSVNMLLMLNGLEVPPVPDPPTEADLTASLNWIQDELLSDFPFCDVDQDGNETSEPSRAHALAMLLTPFMRRMIKGPTPLFCIIKPSSGTGATLLAQLSIMLFEGVDGEGASINYTADEAEMEKKLVAELMKTRSHLFFDDIKDFNNRVLLRALTSSRIGGRLLGRSQSVTGDNNFNWIATGINPNVGDEMHRRTCWIRLNAKKANMRDRQFRHPDISGMDFKSFVQKNRGIAIRHILTLIEYWLANGAPEFTIRRLSSFEDWSAKVGGVLEACGVEGFLESPERIIPDPEKASEEELLREMHKRFGGEGQTFSSLFEWAEVMGLGILSGRTPEARRRHFANTLRVLDGRAFKVGKKSHALGVKNDGDLGVMYRICDVSEGY